MAEIEGGLEGLVHALRVGDDEVKAEAAQALGTRAYDHAANQVLFAEAGAIPLLVELIFVEDALYNIAYNNDANAVAIAAAVGLEEIVKLARRGRVIVGGRWVDAGVPAKRKAALVVAKLIGDCVPDSIPRDIKAAIWSYL
ncbi:hypothetical protein JL721_726 [Aureococcus anophagefferens]|nr:hypothetical protein JL721_726 [Aureococcus anophagefferens]